MSVERSGLSAEAQLLAAPEGESGVASARAKARIWAAAVSFEL